MVIKSVQLLKITIFLWVISFKKGGKKTAKKGRKYCDPFYF